MCAWPSQGQRRVPHGAWRCGTAGIEQEYGERYLVSPRMARRKGASLPSFYKRSRRPLSHSIGTRGPQMSRERLPIGRVTIRETHSTQETSRETAGWAREIRKPRETLSLVSAPRAASIGMGYIYTRLTTGDHHCGGYASDTRYLSLNNLHHYTPKLPPFYGILPLQSARLLLEYRYSSLLPCSNYRNVISYHPSPSRLRGVHLTFVRLSFSAPIYILIPLPPEISFLRLQSSAGTWNRRVGMVSR